jgi:hypothetical protein
MLGVSAAAAADAAPGSVLASVSESHMSKLLRDDVYSRLLEVGARGGRGVAREGRTAERLGEGL